MHCISEIEKLAKEVSRDTQVSIVHMIVEQPDKEMRYIAIHRLQYRFSRLLKTGSVHLKNFEQLFPQLIDEMAAIHEELCGRNAQFQPFFRFLLDEVSSKIDWTVRMQELDGDCTVYSNTDEKLNQSCALRFREVFYLELLTFIEGIIKKIR